MRRLRRQGGVRGSDEARDLDRRADEIGKKRVRREGLGFQFRVELDADEPGVPVMFHNLGQATVR